MGSSNSTPTYDELLLADTTLQSQETKTGPEARRYNGYPDGIGVAFEKEENPVVTLWDSFQRGVRINGDGPMFGTRVYEKDDEKKGAYKIEDKFIVRGDYFWDTYSDVDAIVRAVGSGLCHLGMKKDDNIGIFSLNRSEWMFSALGCWSQSMRIVSLYATLGENAVEYIVTQTEMELIFVEESNVKSLLSLIKEEKIPSVKYIIQYDHNPKYGNFLAVVKSENVDALAKFNVKLIGLSELQKMGEENKNDVNPPQGDDICYIMYTSGTTGNPKGVLLSHANVAISVSPLHIYMPIDTNDVHISYLPLAHIFETVIQAGFMAYGAQIGFYQGVVKKLTHDFIALRPTVLAGVPRVYAKVYQKVFAGVEEKSCFVKWYFNNAYKGTCDLIREGKPRNEDYDNKVFIPLAKKIGLDRCKLVISGAAPLPPHLAEFIKVVVGAAVMQGYGMTESSAILTLTKPEDQNLGHVGPPSPVCEVKLVDVPEMNYLTTDKNPRGEVQVKGPNVFKGYYKNDEATAKTLLEGGWLATGDIGRWNPNGTLSIIDRKKNIFKLANGEYVAAEKIENIYGKSPFVGQVWVYGNSFKNFVVAVVVPSAETVFSLCKEKKWWPTEDAKVGNDQFLEDFDKVMQGQQKDKLKTIIFNSMKENNKDLKRFEIIKDIFIESKLDSNLCGFTEENNCMTPTFKLRRLNLLKKYVKELKELYTANGEPPSSEEKWPGEE